uniref:Large neutral amino acids transporter small subunit 1 n=1 Tax=Panagrellus redivivus TaxID=6233 RepID=A0A7E4V0D0_PANRE
MASRSPRGEPAVDVSAPRKGNLGRNGSQEALLKETPFIEGPTRKKDAPDGEGDGTIEPGSNEKTVTQDSVETGIEKSPAAAEGQNAGTTGTEGAKTDGIRMKKEVGLFSAVGIITGIMVGSGIFISPQFVLKDVGSPFLSLIIWLICGVYSTLGALCYAELSVMIPQSGGDYIYIYEAFGPLPAFMFLWIALVIINPVSVAIVSLAFSTYFANEFYSEDETIPPLVLNLITFALIIMLIALNCYKVRWSKMLQNVCMVVKIACLLAIVVAAIVHLARGNLEQMTKENFFDTSKYEVTGFAMAFYGGILSYAGWNYLNFLTEEMKEPEKDLPRAIYISMPLVTLIYCLLNTAYFIAIPAYVFPTLRAVAYTFAANTMGIFRYSIPVGVCFSCMGTVNGVLFASSRMFFAGARNGHLPEILSMINLNWKTPMPAVITIGSFGMIYSLFAEMELLLSLFTFAMTAIVATGIIALLKMRLYDKRCPDRSLKIFIGIPILFLVMCLFALIVPFFRKPILLGAATGLMLSGVPIYFLFIYWANKPNWLTKPWVFVTHFFQKLCMVVVTDGNEKLS